MTSTILPESVRLPKHEYKLPENVISLHELQIGNPIILSDIRFKTVKKILKQINKACQTIHVPTIIEKLDAACYALLEPQTRLDDTRYQQLVLNLRLIKTKLSNGKQTHEQPDDIQSLRLWHDMFGSLFKHEDTHHYLNGNSETQQRELVKSELDLPTTQETIKQLEPETKKILTTAKSKYYAEVFFEIPIQTSSEYVRNAYATLRQRGVPQKTALLIISALCKRAGALQYGPQPNLAADTLMHVKGSQINIAPTQRLNQTIEPESTYLVMVVNKNDKVCFTGGYAHILRNFLETALIEVLEEAKPQPLSVEHNGAESTETNHFIHMKEIAGESSSRDRARSEKHEHVITAYVHATLKPGTQYAFTAGDDAKQIIFVKVADSKGNVVNPQQIIKQTAKALNTTPDLNIFRQDHFDILVQHLHRESVRMAAESRESHGRYQTIIDRLQNMDPLTIEPTGFRATPDFVTYDLNDHNTEPTHYNKWLARKIILEALNNQDDFMNTHNQPEDKEKLAQKLLESLGAFIPDFVIPQPTVDGIIFGIGEKANKMLLLFDTLTQKYRLPGKYMTNQNENLSAAMRQALADRCGGTIHEPKLLMIENGARNQKLRDPRGVNQSFVYTGWVSALSPTQPSRFSVTWFPLLEFGTNGKKQLSHELRDLIKQNAFDFHHGELIQSSVQEFFRRGVFKDNDQRTLMECVNQMF